VIMDVKKLENRLAESHFSEDPGHLLDGFCIEAHAVLMVSDDDALRDLSSRLENASNAWLARAQANREASGAVWWAWCAGQLRAISSIFQAALLQKTPASVTAALRREHAGDILQGLSTGDMSVTRLAATIEVDTSQTLKMVEVLEKVGLVRSSKEGRERIVSLSPLGYSSIPGRGPGLLHLESEQQRGRSMSTPHAPENPAWQMTA